MAKKQEKEVERWVTVNGARVPIFKDGSIGGSKELRDKLKAHQAGGNNKSGSKERLSIYERQLAEVNDELAYAPKSKALRNEEAIKELEKKKAQLEGYIAKEKGTYGTQTEQSAKKPSVTKVGETSGGSFNIKEMNKKLEAEKKAKAKKEAELSKKASKLKPTPESTRLANEEAQKTKDNYVKEYGVTGARNAEQLREKIKSNGWKIDSADMSDIEHKHLESGDKVTVWDSKGKEYEATYNKYKDGGVELVSVKVKQTEKSSDKNDGGYKYYTESELKDAQFRKDALEEMNRYERNWSSYSLKERRNISPNGVKELRNRIKEIENYEKASKANTIKANDDLKEKQIARNKAEKDEINKQQKDTSTKKTEFRKTLISKSTSALKSMYANASTEEEKRMIAAELGVRGYYRKQGKWSSSGGGR